MTRKIVLGTAALAVVLLLYLLVQERKRGELLEREVNSLKQSLTVQEEDAPAAEALESPFPAPTSPSMTAFTPSTLESRATLESRESAEPAPADLSAPSQDRVTSSAPAEPPVPPTATPSREERARVFQISAATQILGLTSAQQEALRDTLTAAPQDGDAPSFVQALRETVGEDEAQTFVEQQRNAFERATRRELNREVAYLARILALSPEQETQVQQSLSALEVDLAALGRQEQNPLGQSAQERLNTLLERNRIRSKRLQEEFQKILTPEQFTAFLTDEADSEAADLELWHGGPKPIPTASVEDSIIE